MRLSTKQRSKVELYFSEVYKDVFFIEMFKRRTKRRVSYNENAVFRHSRVYWFKIGFDGEIVLKKHVLMHYN